MASPANKKRGEVSLSQAGEGAFLRFTYDSLERLESEYGENYIDIILKGLRDGRVSVYRTCISVSLEKSKVPFPFDMTLEDLQKKIVDAMFMTIYGRDAAEQKKFEDEQFKKDLEEAKENPRMAALLSSSFAEKQGTDRG